MLAGALSEQIISLFGDRVLAFDTAAARVYASLVVRARAQGCPIAVADGQIAAICVSRGATLATRNTKDFTDTGVDLINPWGWGNDTCGGSGA